MRTIDRIRSGSEPLDGVERLGAGREAEAHPAAEVKSVNTATVMLEAEQPAPAVPKRGRGAVGLHLTERDIAMLQFINEFGFCEMPHLDKRFGFKKPRNYQVMERLVEAGLIKHERVFYGRHGIYRLSRAGARYTDLPPLERVPVGNYVHEVTLIDVYLQLSSLYPEALWLSERRLKRDKYFDGVGKRGHLPDGILEFKEGKRVAIEVELSLKGRNRMEAILKGYSSDFSIQEVWYLCLDSVVAPLRAMTAKRPFVKVIRLKEFLHV